MHVHGMLHKLSLDKDMDHLQGLSDGGAADQLFYEDEYGTTPTVYACYHSAPLRLVQVMITNAKLD